MSAAPPLSVAEDFLEARERRWTPGEFRRMTQAGIFDLEESVELVDGEVRAYGRPYLWTRDKYYRLGDVKIFRPDERTELLDGRIIRKVTMNPPHTSAVRRVLEALRVTFGVGFVISGQSASDLSTRNAPEPDAMVAFGVLSDYDDRHPTPAETPLVVEVSDTTLREDRQYKAGLYAQDGIAEYWIVNINARTLEVHRVPSGGQYGSTVTLTEAEAIAPLAALNSPVRVADLLPLARPTHPGKA